MRACILSRGRLGQTTLRGKYRRIAVAGLAVNQNVAVRLPEGIGNLAQAEAATFADLLVVKRLNVLRISAAFRPVSDTMICT